MDLAHYIFYRTIALFGQVFGALAIVFLMLDIIPYDPTVFFLFYYTGPEEKRAQLLAELQASLGIDQPIYIQYYNFLERLFLHGSLGFSWTTGQPVLLMIQQKLPNTLITFGLAFLIYTPLAFLLGILSSEKRGGFFDTSIRISTTATYSIPSYIFGLWIVLLTDDLGFGKWPRPLPETTMELLKYSLFPILVVVLIYTGFQFRLIRAHMLEILRKDYIRTARAKGLSERIVIYKHALRNALPYFVTTVAVTFPITFAGVAALEVVFNIPGVGLMMVQAANSFDWPVLIGVTVLFTTVNAVLLGITDIIIHFFSPKLKFEQRFEFS